MIHYRKYRMMRLRMGMLLSAVSLVTWSIVAAVQWAANADAMVSDVALFDTAAVDAPADEASVSAVLHR